MCCCCHGGCGCYGWHHHGGYYGPRWRNFEEPSPEARREYLVEEKRILEQKLKDIEARISEIGK